MKVHFPTSIQLWTIWTLDGLDLSLDCLHLGTMDGPNLTIFQTVQLESMELTLAGINDIMSYSIYSL